MSIRSYIVHIMNSDNKDAEFVRLNSTTLHTMYRAAKAEGDETLAEAFFGILERRRLKEMRSELAAAKENSK